MSRCLFGKQGTPPTEFEQALLARSEDVEDRWVGIGKRIGAHALFVVLEDLGGTGTISAPTRETFVMRLYQTVRDAEIMDLDRAGVDRREIARTYGVTTQAVGKIIKRALMRGCVNDARNAG